jgi:hypothetical protein
VGAWLFSRWIGGLPYIYGPLLMGTICYYMTGRLGALSRPHACMPGHAQLLWWAGAGAGFKGSFTNFLLFEAIFISINMASLTMGQFCASLTSNVLVGLTTGASVRPLPTRGLEDGRGTDLRLALVAVTVPFLATPMIMFSGLLYQRNLMPVWLSWIEKVSIINYGFSALLLQTAVGS